MRMWGRALNAQKQKVWVEVSTDANGNDDYVYITNLIQVLKLSLEESRFFANYGIPAQRSVVTQIFPDYYVLATQAQFAPFFASLQISKVPSVTPTYRINLITKQGAVFNETVPV